MAVPKPPFKTCGACRTDWADGRSFILDPGVRLLGLQAVPAQPDANVLVFEHRCGSSISTFASGLRYLLGNEEPELKKMMSRKVMSAIGAVGIGSSSRGSGS